MSKYQYGKSSNQQLATVTPTLQAVCRRALSYGVMDASILQGRRPREEQNRYYRLGKSRVIWPNGKHNVLQPDDYSEAVDAAPYVNGSISWQKEHCLVWAGLMLAAAAEESVVVRWGGNWDMDGEPVTDQDFQDLVHFEILI